MLFLLFSIVVSVRGNPLSMAAPFSVKPQGKYLIFLPFSFNAPFWHRNAYS